jgi:hypothetical protein
VSSHERLRTVDGFIESELGTPYSEEIRKVRAAFILRYINRLHTISEWKILYTGYLEGGTDAKKELLK